MDAPGGKMAVARAHIMRVRARVRARVEAIGMAKKEKDDLGCRS